MNNNYTLYILTYNRIKILKKLIYHITNKKNINTHVIDIGYFFYHY